MARYCAILKAGTKHEAWLFLVFRMTADEPMNDLIVRAIFRRSSNQGTFKFSSGLWSQWLYVWQFVKLCHYAKICQQEAIFNANDFFHPRLKFLQVPPETSKMPWSFFVRRENPLFLDSGIHPSSGHHILQRIKSSIRDRIFPPPFVWAWEMD